MYHRRREAGNGLQAPVNLANAATGTSLSFGQWLAPNATAGAGTIIYRQMGVSATGNYNLMSDVFGYVGSGSSSNYYEWLFGAATQPSLRVYANYGAEFGESTPATPPASGLAVGTTGQFQVSGAGAVTAPSSTERFC